MTDKNSAQPNGESSRRDTLLTIFVLCAINLLNFYDRQAPGALVEPMRHEFGLSDTMIGLMGSPFVWVYALVGLPIGWAADVWSRKKLLSAGLAVWSVLTAASGLATGFVFLLFTRLGVGIGEAVCGPVGTSWIGDLFPPRDVPGYSRSSCWACPLVVRSASCFAGPSPSAGAGERLW